MLCNFNTLAGMDVSLCSRLWIHLIAWILKLHNILHFIILYRF